MAPRYGSRLMPVVVDETARKRPDLTYAFIPRTVDISDGFKPVTFSEIANAVNSLALWIETNIGRSSRFDTIAYLGLSDLRYVVVFLAAVKCGYKVLLPSLRNSAWMNAPLLEQTLCSHVLYGHEVEAIVQSSTKERSERSDIRIYQIPSLDELIRSEAKHYPFDKEYDQVKWDPILILHSSGSTGPPKPIQMNHATFAVGDNDRNLPPVPGRVNQNWALWDFPQKENFFSAFPPFHLAGFSSMVMLPIFYENATITLAPPSRPPNGHILGEIMEHLVLRAIFCPPIIAEQLVQEPSGLEKCKNLKFLLYAGGPLSQATGNDLSQVTDVCQFYGSTEMGPIQALVTKREDWASLEWHPMQEAIMEPSIDGTYEMILKRNPALEGIRNLSCTFPDVEVWLSRDIFMPHPTKPNLWTFHGRADDIIVLSNGEKFFPVPSETHIAANPLLSGALISGNGCPQASLVLEPKSHPGDARFFIDELWSTIEEANARAPGHGRITRGMIIVTSPSKPFDRTAKGTVVRSSTEKKYEAEIAQLYTSNAPDNVRPIEIGVPLDMATATKFTKEIVACAFPGHSVEEDDDVFVLGLDSLQATEIISLLKAGILSGNRDADISWVSRRLVYEHPSIASLAGAILDHLNPSSSPSISTEGTATLDRAQKMERMVEKYTQRLPPPQQQQQPALPATESGIHVILTGSTGTLGTQILAKLLSDPTVSSINCLDRSVDARERVARSLALWSPPVAIDNSRVSFHQADYSKPDWGLPPALAAELCTATSVIIHNAWKVNFNHSLESFEAVHVRGIQNLVDLSEKCARARRPRVVFVSSISTVLNWKHTHSRATTDADTDGMEKTLTVVPEHLLTPKNTAEAAQPHGYAESKAVAERILAVATESGIVDASILRVGQIAGPVGAGNGGTWNAHEWFPLLLKTSRALRKVPDGEALGHIDWVPSDVVASVVWEIATTTTSTTTSSTGPARVFHLVNPARKAWAELLPRVQAQLGLGLEESGAIAAVGMREWVAELEKVDVQDRDAVAAMPAVKVLDFFREMTGSRYLGAEDVVFSTDEARRVSESLRDVGPVREEWMEKWMESWGF